MLILHIFEKKYTIYNNNNNNDYYYFKNVKW